MTDKYRLPGAQAMRRQLGLVAVIVIAVALLAACGGSTIQVTQASAGAATVQVSVPPYYVALVGSQPESDMRVDTSPPQDVAEVRATSTGAVLARISPPTPYTFTSVTGAADDRTFVLYGTGPTAGDAVLYATYRQRLFLLRIDPAASAPSARARLTELPAADIAGGHQRQLLAMALSPNGQSLAALFITQIGTPGALTIFNLASGSQRTWTRNICGSGTCANEGIGDGLPLIQEPSRTQLSWTSDSRSLLFIEGPTGSQVRLLDIDAPGTDVMADSRALAPRTAVRGWLNAVITPNGKTVFIEFETGAATIMMNLLRVSAATGHAAVVNQVPSLTGERQTGAGPDDVLWTNYTGSKIIVLGGKPGPKTGGRLSASVPSGQTAGVYDGTRYTPLPWPANVVDAAW